MSGKIQMAHGGGGEMTARLIENIFFKAFGGNPMTANDSAILDLSGGKTAFTTDSYVINPLFFPGGDIGKLAFCGTVNDLASAGARPIAISASFIIEEGIEIDELRRVAESMGDVSRKTRIPIVTGDTKVVDKGSADKLFITTSGVGVIPQEFDCQPCNVRERDKIIVSGTIGDHAYCITAHREGIDIKNRVESDCRPLHDLVEILKPLGKDVRAIRDATRGGLGMVLNDWSKQSNSEILIREEAIPIKDEVRGGCALLGLEPVYLANEGKMVFAISPDCAEEALDIIKTHEACADAAVIGEVNKSPSLRKRVVIETRWGTKRILHTPQGEILPRIC